MIQNDTFKFVVHRKDFLSLSQCQKLMRYLETGEPTESELAGNYDENILNKEVRDNKEVIIEVGDYIIHLGKITDKGNLGGLT